MQKQHVSTLIPYFFKDKNLYVFLHRRSDDAPRNPNGLSGFGGGLEGDENYEQAMLREIKEELNYIPVNYSLLGTFEDDYSVVNYYIEEVDEDFEDKVTVLEGKHGEWHKALDVGERKDVSHNTKKVISAMLEKLS